MVSRLAELRATLAVLAVLTVLTGGGGATLACRGIAAGGEFGDEGTETDALAPDLAVAECDVRRFGDCDEGFKCSWVGDPSGAGEGAPGCVPLLGERGEGEACTLSGDSDDCANHRVCWGADADGQGGVCVEFCSTQLGCDDPLAICSVSNGSQLYLCLPKCDPLIQDCAEGQGCYPDDNKRWACDRDRSGDAGVHGDPCACINCCDPGLVCMPGMRVDAEGCGPEGSPGCCGQVCDLDDQGPPEEVCPTPDERCRAYYDASAVLKGYEKVGLCEG